MVDLGQSVRVRGRAHASFVREQAACHAETHGLLYSHTGHAASHRLRVERQHKDLRKRAGQGLVVHDQDHDAAQDVKRRHDGHDLFGNGGNTLHAAQKDECCDQSHHNAHGQMADAERVMERITDGVGLHHVAHEAQRQNDQYREYARQHLAERALERRADVVRRAAGDFAVDGGAVTLGQHGLGVDRRHAEERRYPHPEQCARPAADKRRGAAGDVAGAHLGSNGGSQRLEAAHALVIGLFAAQRKAAEHAVEPLAKAAQLYAPQPDGKKHAGADQQEQQQRVPQNVAGPFNGRRKNCHEKIPLFLHLVFYTLTTARLARTM